MSFWLSSFTKRWHTHPMLSETNDPVSGHQQRVAMILLQLEPDVSRDAIIRAITHDQGEFAAGDIPYGFKRKHPDVAETFSIFEDKEIEAQGFPVTKLSNRETSLMKLADWTDAYLWAHKHQPKLVDNHPAWIQQMCEMIEVSVDIGVSNMFTTIIQENGNWKN